MKGAPYKFLLGPLNFANDGIRGKKKKATIQKWAVHIICKFEIWRTDWVSSFGAAASHEDFEAFSKRDLRI